MADPMPLVPMADPTAGDDSEGQGGAAEPTLPDALDEGNPYAIVSMVAPALKRMMLELPPEVDDLEEGELRQMVKPTATDYSLRASFWRTYEAAVRLGKEKLTNTEIYGGICSPSYFHKFCCDPHKVAWLIRPMQTYKREMEALLSRGNQRLWEIMDMQITDDDGRVNPRRAEVFLKAYEQVANRVKGMAVQRVHEKRLNVNMRIPGPSPQAVPKESMESLRKRLKDLQEKPRAKPLPEGSQSGVVIDAAEDRTESVSSRDGDREIVTVGVVRSSPDGAG